MAQRRVWLRAFAFEKKFQLWYPGMKAEPVPVEDAAA
jgi:hypothetical protein